MVKYVDGLELVRPLRRGMRSFYHRARPFRIIVCFAALTLLFIWSAPVPTPPDYMYTRSCTTATDDFDPTRIHIVDNLSVPNVGFPQRLPHIAPKIWQVFLSDKPDVSDGMNEHTLSWISKSPSYSYTILDTVGAHATVVRLANLGRQYDHALPIFYAMSRHVMRADFLRYLLLAFEGGAYGDIDTQLVRPLHEWVPEKHRNKTKLVIGLECDQSPPVPATTYEVQFAQWTMAGAKDHPVFWAMVDRILERVAKKRFEDAKEDANFSDSDVLAITGPVGWTEVIYAHLSKETGRTITWLDLHKMREPRLFGDTLVLPINGYGTGLRHSHASQKPTEQTMVRHYFAGAWKHGTS